MKCNNCKPEGKCDRHQEFELICERLNLLLIEIRRSISLIQHYAGDCWPSEELETAHDRISESRDWLESDLRGE